MFANGKGECLFVQSMVGGGLSDGRRRGRQLYNMRCRCLLQFAASLTGFVLTSLLRDNNTYHIAQVVVPQMPIGTQHPSYAIYPIFDANSTH